MRRAAADLWLGLRLAPAGGPDARWRAALTASGAALGVALLLFAAAIPHIVHAHYQRLDARVPLVLADGSATHPSKALLLLDDGTVFHGVSIAVRTVQPLGPGAPLPPGINHLPRPGQMLVSPGVRKLLDSAAGAELSRRLHARVSGTIGEAGLTGPRDLFVYRGATDLQRQPGAETVIGFGTHPQSLIQGPLLTLLVILMVVALLLPIGVFVATASRFGSEQRNARLAALRLLGADRAGTARIAAGEALFGATIGVVAGVALFLALRPLTGHVEVAGISIFAQDVRPSPLLALIAVVLVPTAAVAFALLAMRDVAIEPLGVTRHATPPRRRLLWRLLTPLAGFALLVPLIGAGDRLGSTGGEVEAAAGVVFVLIGVSALLPWCVEAAIARADGGGSLAWLLAVRRLRLDHGTSARVVGAIGLTVAGAIALQSLFSAADVDTAQHYKASPVKNTFEISNAVVRRPDAAAFVERRLLAIDGVRSAQTVATIAPDSRAPITVEPCATLLQLVSATSCSASSSYVMKSYGVGVQLRPGQRIRVARNREIAVPKNAMRVGLKPGSAVGPVIVSVPVGALLMTPHEAAKLGVEADVVDAVVRLDRSNRDGSDHLQDVVATLDPLASVDEVVAAPSNPVLVSLRHALVAGAIAVLLVIGGSLLVAAAEQLRERRRVLAVLAAFGTRRSTLAASVLWQTALPVAMGLALAITIGTALGAVLLEVAALPVSFDWTAILLLAGTGMLVVGAVTGLTLPLLWRQTRAEALRAE